MLFFYNLFILFYCLFIRLYGRINSKASKRSKAQFQIPELPDEMRRPIWIHAASVGEFEQALPLYDELKKRHPDDHFLFSFFSPSGYTYAHRKYPELNIIYLPADIKILMKRLIERFQPKQVIIIKYEFWFHFLNELKKKKVPIFLVSGIFRKEQMFFIPILGIFFRKMLSRFTHLFVQDEHSAILLRSVGITKVTVCGDTRYDRVLQNKALPLGDPVIASCIQSEFVFVAGSVWKQDKDVVEAIVKLLPRYYQIIIAPHETEESEFWKQLFPEISALYTSYKAQPKRILILDTIGVLSKSYRRAKFAYIGGGFGKGIHNILEASVYHIPVIFGPKYRKFREAVELTERQLAFPVDTAEEAVSLVSEFLLPENPLGRIRETLEEYFAKHANISSQMAVLIDEMSQGRT